MEDTVEHTAEDTAEEAIVNAASAVEKCTEWVGIRVQNRCKSCSFSKMFPT